MPFSLRLTQRKILLVTVDLILVNLTTFLALWIWSVRGDLQFNRIFILDQIELFLFLSALWLFFAYLNGLYDPTQITRLDSATLALLRTVAMVITAYIAIYFFATPAELPRGVVLYQSAIGFVLIGLWRTLYVLPIQRFGFARKVIIVGAGWAGQTIADSIRQYANAYYQIHGFIDDDPAKAADPATSARVGREMASTLKSSASAPLRILGTSSELVRIVKEQGVPEVILAITHDVSTSVFRALLECKEQGVQITLMPVLFEQLTGRVPIEHIGDNWNVALPLDSAETGGFYPIAKRILDVTGALLGLALFLALFPFIAIPIYIDFPGPIFYSHERVGKGGKVFKLFKLRTMIPNAEPDGQPIQAQLNDPRITRVGKLLRKMRLDEMPQLFNVLKGEMSAVGPRPERPQHLIEFNREIPFHRLRNAVKPGMAGWAVVNYDYIDSVEDAKVRLQYDLYYIKHQSIWLDIIILLRTMGQV